MIIKNFKHVGKNGKGIYYLVQERELQPSLSGFKKEDIQPEILLGDIKQTADLIDSLSFKTRYTSGVLTFEETDIPREDLYRIIDSFESDLVFPGLLLRDTTAYG